MNKKQSRELVKQTLTHQFDKARFLTLTGNILHHIDQKKAAQWNHQYVKDAFKDHIDRFERLGTYTSPEKEALDVLVVHVTKESKLERARTALRNFVADHLKQRDDKDAALVAFVSPEEKQWRFSYVKMEYATTEKDGGKIGVEAKVTPARRFSYIVGEGESCHTAQTRFLDLLKDGHPDPMLAEIEDAFSVEAVTKEFYEEYRQRFEKIEKALRKLAADDDRIKREFEKKNVSTVDFAKKLMGQIVFLYFLQKKGWLGVAKGAEWGTGPRDFLRKLANGNYSSFGNFFNDVLEPLFYDTLATDRGHEAWCDHFKCRIPFLNGGLFEPLGNYDWRKTNINLLDKLFTNSEYVEEGVKGTGVLDLFDRYNFTVNEAEPREKEVAIDPEMLGKVFENLIEENLRKGLGSYYTPREIVHYMCQESLINYLDTAINTEKELVPRADIETFVHLGEQISHYESVETKYSVKMAASIQKYARQIDDSLAGIAVCDPAVGSGAFPVGMMTEIVRARCALTPYFNDFHERTPYFFKRHAIQSCLYGVDIDPGAVEIAKLRLWLSLVVDEEDVKQIRPLPNLDYKLVAGNSLIGLPFRVLGQTEIEMWKDRFTDEVDHDRKAVLKGKIDEAIRGQLQQSAKSFGFHIDFDFQLWFSEVFREKRGFDVVIANPPYVSAIEFKRTHDEEEREALNSLFRSARGTYDIYVLFIEKGIRLLRPAGSLAFINPNKYLAAKYALALRELLISEAQLVQLLDVSGIRVFKEQDVYPVVSVMRSGPAKKGYEVQLVLPVQRESEKFEPRQFVRSKVSSAFLTALPENIWGFLLSTHVDLLLKLIRGTQSLSDVAQVNASTTAAEADDFGKHLTEKDGESALKVVNTGTIDRYLALWGSESMSHGGRRFLRPYLPLAKAGVSARREALYRKPKVIVAKLARECEAFFDSEGEFASLNTNCIYEAKGVALDFLAGYCNSRLFMFFYDQFFGALRMSGGFYQFQAPQLRVVPFKVPPEQIQARVSKLVGEIIAAKSRSRKCDTSKLEALIDAQVYSLYSLTKEDIAVVEGSKVSRASTGG